jgi:hypothetical protein
LLSGCRRTEPPPGRGCLERYENGDEVRLSYDSADPRDVWMGQTPGGGYPTMMLYGGMTLVTFGVIWLWFIAGLPWVKRRLGIVRTDRPENSSG